MKITTMSDIGSESEDIDYESDSELQEAFAKGLLKPGLNTVSVKEVKQFTNNVNELKQKLTAIKLKLPWVERLDLVTGHAPLAPEMAFELQEQERIRENKLRNQKGAPMLDPATDPVLNDFHREMLFHRQAQAAVLDGIARLKVLGIPTKRPEDYFAQMAKSDDHMQKVRETLQRKKHEVERSEKVRNIRKMLKMNKQLQVESRLKRDREKRELNDEVKKFRQKKRTDLDFLDDKMNKKRPSQLQQKPKPGGKKGFLNKRAQAKKDHKENKFGFGGKKRFLKSNTKASSRDVSDYRAPPKDRRPVKERLPQHKQSHRPQQRPGKNRRTNQKARRKH